MADSGLSATPALWLWLDVESTGLLDSRPSVLEAAWMVTDAELRQLTPLRTRLTGIPWFGQPPVTTWPADLPEIVARMHQDNGLQDEWVDAGEGRRLTAVEELDVLVRGDVDGAVIHAGGSPVDPPPLHLAGAGVANFDSRLLAGVGSQIPEWCHYRCADTSVAAMVLGMPKLDADPADGLVRDVPSRPGHPAFTLPHRAGTDVRAAYHVASVLREATGRFPHVLTPSGGMP